MTNANAKPDAISVRANFPPETLAETLDSLRAEFQGVIAAKRKNLDRTRARFDNSTATGLLDAVGSFGSDLAKAVAIIGVWDVFEAAYLPDDATGATWATLSDLADRLMGRLLADAADPNGSSDLIRASIEASKAAGRAAALRDVQELISFAEGKVAAAAPDAAEARAAIA